MKGIIANNRPILFIALSALLAILISTLSIFINLVFAFTISLLVFIIGIIFLFVFISLKGFKSTIILGLMLVVYVAISSIFLVNVHKYNSENLIGNQLFYGTVIGIDGAVYDEDDNKYLEVVVDGSIKGHKVKANAKIPFEYKIIVGNKIEFSANFIKSGVYFDNTFIINVKSSPRKSEKISSFQGVKCILMKEN